MLVCGNLNQRDFEQLQVAEFVGLDAVLKFDRALVADFERERELVDAPFLDEFPHVLRFLVVSVELGGNQQAALILFGFDDAPDVRFRVIGVMSPQKRDVLALGVERFPAFEGLGERALCHHVTVAIRFAVESGCVTLDDAAILFQL